MRPVVVVIVVIVLHAHHFGELLEGESTVAIFVKCIDDEVATWHADVLVFHGVNVFDEVFQFLKGKAAAVVSVRFVEHRHEHLHHVAFKGFFEGRVLVLVVVLVMVVIGGFVLIVVLVLVVVLVMVVIVIHVPSNPELIPGETAVVVGVEC